LCWFHRYLKELESYVKDPEFKHKDFWDRELSSITGVWSWLVDFEKADIGTISDDEARLALEDE
jgi:hypothetical protein